MKVISPLVLVTFCASAVSAFGLNHGIRSNIQTSKKAGLPMVQPIDLHGNRLNTVVSQRTWYRYQHHDSSFVCHILLKYQYRAGIQDVVFIHWSSMLNQQGLGFIGAHYPSDPWHERFTVLRVLVGLVGQELTPLIGILNPATNQNCYTTFFRLLERLLERQLTLAEVPRRRRARDLDLTLASSFTSFSGMLETIM